MEKKHWSYHSTYLSLRHKFWPWRFRIFQFCNVETSSHFYDEFDANLFWRSTDEPTWTIKSQRVRFLTFIGKLEPHLKIVSFMTILGTFWMKIGQRSKEEVCECLYNGRSWSFNCIMLCVALQTSLTFWWRWIG